MNYPRTLHLTPDGVAIVVQRHTARAVATAARATMGDMTISDAHELWLRWPAGRDACALAVVALADWIARSLGMDDEMRESARDFAGKKGIPR